MPGLWAMIQRVQGRAVARGGVIRVHPRDVDEDLHPVPLVSLGQ